YEEVDYVSRAELLGYHVVYLPGLNVIHEPSPVNRRDNVDHLDVTRLYATYKRYRWVDRCHWRAAVFSLTAPAHLMASHIKNGRWRRLRQAVRSIRTAAR